MNYLNLQQSIDYLKERLAISYFDLPQLAHLCSEKKLIPYFHFVGLMAKTDNPPYFIEYFNGYLTSIELLKILANPHQWETLSLHHALRYTENPYQEKNDPFTWDWVGLSVNSEMLEHENFGEYAYSCSGFIKYENGYPLSLQDICFDREQLESIAPAGDTQSQAGEPKTLPVIGEYTTPAMQAMNAVINEFWIEYTPDKIPPKQENVINWIMENYGFSRNLSLAIEQVARPESAKTGGNKAI